MSDTLSRMTRVPAGLVADIDQHCGTRMPTPGKLAESTPSNPGVSTLFSAKLYALLQHMQQTLALWRERSRSRHDLARLMPGMHIELLAQGLDADSEARKPFWRA